MPNELSIQGISPLLGAGDTAVPLSRHAVPAAPVAAPAEPAKMFANPDYRFDPAAGLAVIEFRDDAGKVTDSIPNQRQLDAYRAHQGEPEGPPPTKIPDGTAATG